MRTNNTKIDDRTISDKHWRRVKSLALAIKRAGGEIEGEQALTAMRYIHAGIWACLDGVITHETTARYVNNKDTLPVGTYLWGQTGGHESLVVVVAHVEGDYALVGLPDPVNSYWVGRGRGGRPQVAIRSRQRVVREYGIVWVPNDDNLYLEDEAREAVEAFVARASQLSPPAPTQDRRAVARAEPPGKARRRVVAPEPFDENGLHNTLRAIDARLSAAINAVSSSPTEARLAAIERHLVATNERLDRIAIAIEEIDTTHAAAFISRLAEVMGVTTEGGSQ